MTRLQLEIALGTIIVVVSTIILILFGFSENRRMARFEEAQQAHAIEVGWRSPSLLALYRWQVAKVRAVLDSENLDPEDIAAARKRGALKTPEEQIAEELTRI